MKANSPITAALNCADAIDGEAAKAALLETVATLQLRAGSLEDALQTAEKSPKKTALMRRLAIDATTANEANSLLAVLKNLVAADPEASPLAGRLAQSLLDNGNVDGALKIIREIKEPFEGERARYDFVAKLYDNDRFDEAATLTQSFKDPGFRDWANLALTQRLAKRERRDAAVRTVDLFPTPEKQAWACQELGRILSNGGDLLRRAATILETVVVKKENAEVVAIQRRILGNALVAADDSESARELFESSEAAIAAIVDPFRRFRAQCFLAKTLRKTGELDSVRNYVSMTAIDESRFAPLERSELLQWFAEASADDADWTLAVLEAAREKDETKQSRRIGAILQRFSSKDAASKPTGEPDQDAVLLAGVDFENHYFSPFAVEGCGC